MIAGSGLATVLRMNTRLFLNCLSGVSDEHGRQRANERTNSITFIACHITDSRYFVARYLGLEEKNPLENVLRDVNSIEDVGELPLLEDVREIWRLISPTVEACINGLSEDELRAPSPQRFPVDQLTVYGGIGFLVQHESYHLGQLALLRKFHGYPAMKYG